MINKHSENNFKIWDQEAKTFDDFTEKSYPWLHIEKPFYQKLFKKMGLVAKKNYKFLDLGCGSGRITKLLLQNKVPSENILAIDNSLELLKIFKIKFPNIQSKNINITHKFDLETKYDTIISHHVFEHFDLRETLTCFKNVLKHLNLGGKFILFVGHPFRYSGTEYFKKNWYQQVTPWGSEIFHYPKTIENYSELLDKAGFKFVRFFEPKIQNSGKGDRVKFTNYSQTPSRLAIVCVKR